MKAFLNAATGVVTGVGLIVGTKGDWARTTLTTSVCIALRQAIDAWLSALTLAGELTYAGAQKTEERPAELPEGTLLTAQPSKQRRA
jgi:hypothetical protein